MDLGLRALDEVLDTADASLTKGESAAGKAWPTGFSPLDAYLSGGVRSGELVLVGGPQGFGKTTWVLQVLRNIVAGGDHGVYFSYEHDESTILERL
jgi:replicative DNA helicase